MFLVFVYVRIFKFSLSLGHDYLVYSFVSEDQAGFKCQTNPNLSLETGKIDVEEYFYLVV